MAKQTTENRRRTRLPVLDTPEIGETAPAQLRNRPANENDAATAILAARLRKQPSSAVYGLAFVLVCLWIFGWFFTYNDMLFSAEGIAKRSSADVLHALTLFVLPIGGIVALAYFLWRAQQLRQVSEVLMQSAMRLIRPQDLAADGLTSIAQAVRQEVDLLVGGVEHAFQRATALEEIVHKEIAAVERAFGSNEDRIRGLVTGLETQRLALQQTSALVSNDANPMLSRLETNTQNLGQVINLALSTFARLEDGLTGSTTQLARTIEDVAARAAITGQEIGGHSAQFERMSTTLVNDFRGFSSQLQEYVQTLNFTANTLGNETRRFGGEVKGMESSLLQLLRESADQLVSANTEVGQTIERLSSGSVANLKQAAGELTQSFGQIEESVTYHLKSASTEISNLIERSGNDTAQRIDQSRNLVTQGLQGVASEFIHHVEGSRNQLIGYIDQTGNQLAEAVDAASSRFAERITGSSSLILAGLDQSGNHFASQLSASGATIANQIDEVSGTLSAQLDRHGQRISSKMQETAETHAQALASSSQNFTGFIEQSFGQAVASFTDASGKLDVHANRLTVSIQETAEKHGLTLSSASETFNSYIEQSFGQAYAGFTDASGKLDSHANRLSGTIQETAEKHGQILASLSENFTITVQQSLGQAVAGLNDATTRIDDSASSIHSSLNSASQLVAGQMQSVGSNVNDLLVATSGTIAAHLKETSEIVGRQMQDSGLALSQNIEVSGGVVTDRLIAVAGEFVQKVSSTRDGMLSSLISAASELTGKLQNTSNEIHTQLEDVTGRISVHMTNTAGTVTDRVLTVADNLTGKLDSSTAQLGAILTNTESRLGNQLEQAATELNALFDVNTRMMTEQLEQSSSTVTATFANTAVRAAQALNVSSEEVTAKIDGASQSMFIKLDGTTRELNQRFDVATNHLDQVTTDISKRLDGTGQRFAEILNSASGQIFTDLGRARDAFSEGLGETTMQISGRFEQETGLLVGRIDRASEEFDSTATASASKLDDASRKFTKHIETTNAYLADQLASAAGDIDNRLESVSMQLTGKLEMTGSRISERLDDVSALVDKSVEKFNTEMELMLVSRKEALDDLVSDANRRATEVDNVMSSYIKLIEDSLNTAEARAMQINRIVSDQTAAALARLEEELLKLETNSTGQVSQAARVMREQHERAMVSMNEMLSSTASDFQQTAQDMRITAQQVVKDIDSARGDLKRAVIDMPEETRVNADNMRRVVADQIGALNALAEVVRKQSGMVDYSGPSFASPRSPQGSGSGKYEGTAFNAPVSGTLSAPRNQAERASASATRIAEPAAGARTAPPAAQALSGLAKEVDAYTQKLHVSARDLVEAIDGVLPRELEKRFAANERGVYTQRLYESRSRKLVKSLEQRYAAERLLRGRVQSYNRLFEKLLDTLSEAPGGAVVMEQVLGSEQGRIYVMLAEAAGRMPSDQG